LHAATYWEIIMGGLTVKGTTYGANSKAIVDSGTSLLTGPSETVKAIAQSIGAKEIIAGEYMVAQREHFEVISRLVAYHSNKSEFRCDPSNHIKPYVMDGKKRKMSNLIQHDTKIVIRYELCQSRLFSTHIFPTWN
jgi:hypothetical protein